MTRTTQRRRAGKAAQRIRIRMYRVGFGDCFLLTLPVGDGEKHILIDCGVHSAGNVGTMDQVVEDIAAATGGKLALVIATHAHQDHISGFGSHSDTFLQMTAGEVWMPWTENPKDPTARRHKKKLNALVGLVAQHIQALNRKDAASRAAADAINLLKGNEKALKVLREGFSGAKLRYLELGKKLSDAAGIKGLSVQVLGPPRDESLLIKEMPTGSDKFFRLGAKKGQTDAVNALRPFDEQWITKNSENESWLSPDEIRRLSEDAMDRNAAAFQLDKVMNNTSLVLLLSYRGENMLFTGDAQYGNWKGWIDQDWADELLGSVTFFKLAHHASHNATPKTALERMTTGEFIAMVSTQNKPWGSIPMPKLMTGLQKKASGVARSDTIGVKGFPAIKGGKPNAAFKKGACWYDCLLDTRS